MSATSYANWRHNAIRKMNSKGSSAYVIQEYSMAVYVDRRPQHCDCASKDDHKGGVDVTQQSGKVIPA